MKRSSDAQRKKEFSRLKKTATALARKAAAVDRERIKLDKTLQKWARTHKVAARSYASTHAPGGGGGKPCKPIIDHPTGPYVCVLIYSTPGKCVYRCYRI